MLGFLGPNGAGKSTTMKMLTCFLAPTAGRAKVAGHDVFDDSLEVRRRIGYLPEDTPLYRDMTVLEYLQFAADMRGMEPAKIAGRIKEIGERCGLADVAGKLVGELSKGYRQRVGLAQAMLHDPGHPDPRRADERPRPEPDRRDPLAHQGDRPGEDGHPVDPHPPRGAGDLQPHRHHQRRQAGRRRHAPTTLRAAREGRRATAWSSSRTASSPEAIRDRLVEPRGRRPLRDRRPARRARSSFAIDAAAADDLRKPIFRAAVDNRWTLLELARESASLEDVFRNLTTGEEGQS